MTSVLLAPRHFPRRLSRTDQLSGFSLARARFVRDGEQPGKLLLPHLDKGHGKLSSKRHVELADAYGVMADFMIAEDLQWPELLADDFGAGGVAEPAGQDAPRYLAPRDMASTDTDDRVLQVFGPHHCVDGFLGCLAGWSSQEGLCASLEVGTRVIGECWGMVGEPAGTTPPHSKEVSTATLAASDQLMIRSIRPRRLE